MKTKLKPPGIKHLKLKCDILLSPSAFRFNLRRYNSDLNLYGIHPALHAWVDRSFSFLVTSGLFGILIAMHRCAEIDLYGFQVHARHGVQYHYYNPADLPANEDRDSDEWYVVKALVKAELVRFAEPCIVECHEGVSECKTCQEDNGLEGGVRGVEEAAAKGPARGGSGTAGAGAGRAKEAAAAAAAAAAAVSNQSGAEKDMAAAGAATSKVGRCRLTLPNLR